MTTLLVGLNSHQKPAKKIPTEIDEINIYLFSKSSLYINCININKPMSYEFT